MRKPFLARLARRVAVVALVVAAFLAGHFLPLPVGQPSDSSTVQVDGQTCHVQDMSRISPSTGGPVNTLLDMHC